MPAPTRVNIPPTWPYAQLFQRVKEALQAAPAYFKSEINIKGVPATDIQNLNTLLGATIEERVVDTLNSMRSVWDPRGDYSLYSFVRQAQTFPDVLLRRAYDADIIMGIELKGWYLLAKEEEPSFRFVVTPAVCNPQDLIVVYPWHFSEVISGTPVLIQPYIEHAKYVAEYRNWNWMDSRSTNPVILAPAANPYPRKSDNISDKATRDDGGNFGRIARANLLESLKAEANARLLAGIPASRWRAFFKIFSQSATTATMDLALQRLRADVLATPNGNEDEADALVAKLRPVAELLLA
jgi:hypothetical protein